MRMWFAKGKFTVQSKLFMQDDFDDLLFLWPIATLWIILL